MTDEEKRKAHQENGIRLRKLQKIEKLKEKINVLTIFQPNEKEGQSVISVDKGKRVAWLSLEEALLIRQWLDDSIQEIETRKSKP